MKNILIIDEMHLSIIPMLESIGYNVSYEPAITERQVFEVIDRFEGLIVRSKIFIGKEILEKAQRLRFIGRAGAGLDQIVEEEVVKRGIQLLNAPEGNRDAVAEHALGLLLCLMNNMHMADREVRNGIWLREENRGFEIGGKAVAVIGYGNNGKAFARRLKGFGVATMAYDILHRQNFEDENARAATMEEIFATADVVSLHVPLTNDTDKMVNKEYLRKFRKNIWLVNSSRGQVVVLDDLLDMLDSGKVLGAGLDVLETENLVKFKTNQPDTYMRLMNHGKVLLTPHVAGWTQESYVKINETLVAKIKALEI